MNIKSVTLSLFFATLFALGVRAANTTTTVTQVTNGVDLTTDVDYVITSADAPFATAGSVNIVNTEHAVVIFKNIKPSKVISTYLSNIYINGEQAVSDGNCQVRMYNTGAIVFPYGDTAALTCYTEENFEGDSYNGYRIGNSGGYMLSLSSTSLNNSIRSFKLKRGYMVTFAVGTGGWGYSRCFIADQEDLEVSSVPYPLNGKISSYRLFHWYNAQKKGLANDTGATITDALNVTSCYSFGLGETRLPDAECVPHHIYEDWPSSSACGGVTYSCHMKTNNEPGNSSDDTPQDVDVVLDNWQNLMRTGMRLCSESSHDGSMNHLKAFIDSIDARGWRCDIVDLHCYWDSGTFNSLTWYSDYYGNGRPIWISEWVWGASWNSNGFWARTSDAGSFSTSNQQICYDGTKPILDVLNSNTRVERYYYWNSESVGTRIYYDGQLSILGEYYSTMDSGLGYNASEEFVPKVVFSAPSALSSTYTKRSGSMELSWTDPNGDMIDSLIVQCKLPGSNRWVDLATIAPKDKSSKSDITYTYTDYPSDPGVYYYRVVEYYTNTRGSRTSYTTNEETCTVSAAYSVGSLQYGQLKIADTEKVSTDIEAQDVAPYVVMGMISNKNTGNGITNNLISMAKSSFTFRFYPWRYTSPVDFTNAETVDYLVLPPDTVMNLSDDMMLISAQTSYVKGDEVEVLFPEAYPEGVTPVVVAQQFSSVTSYAPVTVKVYDITNIGFKMKLVAQEAESSIGQEKVNYFACTPGQLAIGEGKLLTVGRNSDTPCGGTGRHAVCFTSEEGDTLHFVDPYIIAAPQTNNYAAASVFRQHSSSSDDDGVYSVTIRRQADETSTVEEKDNASSNGDYIGWFVVSTDPNGSGDEDPLIVPTAIESVKDTGFSVTASDGCLWTDNPSLRAYTAAGVQVRFGVRLPEGVYIITDGSQSRKLLLKK